MGNGTPEQLMRALRDAGVTHAFGLPGTQNIDIFEALRNAPIRTVVASHELGASLMANGYFRASGRTALLTTIPGPGFTYAVTGLAEAYLDSAAIVHLTSAPARGPGQAYQLQALDQAAMVRPIVKGTIEIGPTDDPQAAVRRAVSLALAGEPGPVLLQSGAVTGAESGIAEAPQPADGAAQAAEVAALMNGSSRIVMLLGQGAATVAAAVTALAERVGAAVVTTTSGRGVVPEDHRLSLGFEMAGVLPGPLNELIAAGDLVLALGCKFSHNGSRGFGLVIPPEKLVHVDASAAVLGANYPARIGAVAALEDFLPELSARVEAAEGWSDAELVRWREAGTSGSWPQEVDPLFAGRWSAAEVVGALQGALSRDAVVVTDSGRHQMILRRWLRVLAPRGLVVPTNLQSMGFAIPAAIGAKLAAPDRPVVAVLGDGGLRMSGLEILTAVKEQLDLTVVVFNDGAYGLIKKSQLAAYGTAPGSELDTGELAAFAGALGVSYVRIGDDPADEFRKAVALPGVTLIEVPVREGQGMRVVRAKGTLKRLAGPWLRRLLGR